MKDNNTTWECSVCNEVYDDSVKPIGSRLKIKPGVFICQSCLEDKIDSEYDRQREDGK